VVVLPGTSDAEVPLRPGPDPRRWVTLAIVTVAVVIVSLDNTILNVAIPTILRDFHTTLPSLQWVITGYALTFATLLIIGGRLGDIYGHRRMFILGAALFGVGSLIAALSNGVMMLVGGEAIIEGIGASLMLPATLAILSITFEGRERAAAFGVWGAVGGTSAVLGPVVGGFLTTNYSWRWSFGINVIVTPLAVIGAMVFMPEGERSDRGGRLDFPGAMLIAVGMFLLVFGLSEGGSYGWLTPIAPFTVAGRRVWDASRPVSVVPIAAVLAVLVLVSFYRVERRKERTGAGPLFEFGQLRHRGFRYGLLTTLVMGIGQFGLAFVLPVFLQEGKHLTAERNGLWQLPTGVFVVVGAQVGSRLTRRISVTAVVRIGLVFLLSGFLYVAAVISGSLTFWLLLPGLAVYGTGVGFATTQLTNVVLYDVDRDKSGVASGANSTARQVGLALGVAIIGSLLTAETTKRAISGVRASALAPAYRAHTAALLRSQGVNFVPAPGSTPTQLAVINRAFLSAVGSGARVPLLFAAGAVAASIVVSIFLPRVDVGSVPASAAGIEGLEDLESLESGSPITASLFE
jgi:EmrB/QacA subfamily drug resistance transporter